MTPLEIVLLVVVAVQTAVIVWATLTRRPSGVDRVLIAQSEALTMLAHRGMNAALLSPGEQGARVWREEETDAAIGASEESNEPRTVPGGLSAGYAAPGMGPFDRSGRPLVGMP